jgi:hypothetical protein
MRFTSLCLMGVSLTGVYLKGVHLTGMHLIGVHLTGVHLTGVSLIGVHLTGILLIHLTGIHLLRACTSVLASAGGWFCGARIGKFTHNSAFASPCPFFVYDHVFLL